MTKRYPGINPHLNSALQQRGGGWRSFHAYYLIMIADTLNEILPENYYVTPEDSLQIGTYDGEIERPSQTIADILLHGQSSGAAAAPVPDALTPTLTLPVLRLIADEDELSGLVIYNLSGEAVTRIELLSPANKPTGSHFGNYLQKRDETLQGGLRLVEIDFIHTRRPLISDIPDYTKQEKGARPYHILVTDPRPSILKGKTDVYSFGVLDTIPVIAVPLDGADYVRVDFGRVYDTTINKRTFRRQMDYTKPPVNFDSYTPEDQTLILAQMARIAEEQP